MKLLPVILSTLIGVTLSQDCVKVTEDFDQCVKAASFKAVGLDPAFDPDDATDILTNCMETLGCEGYDPAKVDLYKQKLLQNSKGASNQMAAAGGGQSKEDSPIRECAEQLIGPIDDAMVGCLTENGAPIEKPTLPQPKTCCLMDMVTCLHDMSKSICPNQQDVVLQCVKDQLGFDFDALDKELARQNFCQAQTDCVTPELEACESQYTVFKQESCKCRQQIKRQVKQCFARGRQTRATGGEGSVAGGKKGKKGKGGKCDKKDYVRNVGPLCAPDFSWESFMQHRG